ncbi:hypothetical protein Tco_0300281 [Tanacetum coccineum]
MTTKVANIRVSVTNVQYDKAYRLLEDDGVKCNEEVRNLVKGVPGMEIDSGRSGNSNFDAMEFDDVMINLDKEDAKRDSKKEVENRKEYDGEQEENKKRRSLSILVSLGEIHVEKKSEDDESSKANGNKEERGLEQKGSKEETGTFLVCDDGGLIAIGPPVVLDGMMQKRSDKVVYVLVQWTIDLSCLGAVGSFTGSSIIGTSLSSVADYSLIEIFVQQRTSFLDLLVACLWLAAAGAVSCLLLAAAACLWKHNTNSLACLLTFCKLNHDLKYAIGLAKLKAGGLKILAWNKVGSEARDKLWDEMTQYCGCDLTVRKLVQWNRLGQLLRYFRPEEWVNFVKYTTTQAYKVKSALQVKMARVPSVFILHTMDGRLKKKEIEQDEEPNRDNFGKKLKDKIKEGEPCRLWHLKKSTIIAEGAVYKNNGKIMLHNKALPKDCYKVSIDKSLVDATFIPDVGSNGCTTVLDAVGGFVAWPKNQVVFDPKNKTAPKVPTKRKNFYVSSDAMQKEANKKRSQKALVY